MRKKSVDLEIWGYIFQVSFLPCNDWIAICGNLIYFQSVEEFSWSWHLRVPLSSFFSSMKYINSNLWHSHLLSECGRIQLILKFEGTSFKFLFFRGIDNSNLWKSQLFSTCGRIQLILKFEGTYFKFIFFYEMHQKQSVAISFIFRTRKNAVDLENWGDLFPVCFPPWNR